MLFTGTEYHNNTVPYLLMQVYRSYTYITGKGTLSSLTSPPAGRLSSFMGCCFFFHVDIPDHYLSGSNCTISSWRNNAAHLFPLTIDVRTALLATVLKIYILLQSSFSIG